LTLTLKFQNEKYIESPFTIIKQNVSEEEFWAFANEDIKCELLDGALIIHSPANSEHEDLFSYLMTLFRIYLDDSKLGKVFGSRLVMKLSNKWSPEPDLMIITPDKYKNLKNGRFEGPADIVIEILSESTRETDINKKLPEFLNKGVKEVWIIDPKEKTVTLHSADYVHEYKDPNSEVIIKSLVLPDFKLKINWIWDRDKFPTSVIIKNLI
jgi:Uma2 family endonuclease